MGTKQSVTIDVNFSATDRAATNGNAEEFHRFEYGSLKFNRLEYRNLVFITSGDDLLTMAEVCDAYIQHVLAVCKGNKLKAASALGIGRTSLYRYISQASRQSANAHGPDGHEK